MVDPSSPNLGRATSTRRPKPTTRERVITAGFSGDVERVLAHADDHDPQVRLAVLGAKNRLGLLNVSDTIVALRDPDWKVRRRALELSATVTGRGVKTTLMDAVVAALADAEPLVVDAACWAIGERRIRSAVHLLCTLARTHVDPRCREAAVAALGAIGDGEGLDTIVACLDDKPNIRRRVVVALASFEGDAVDRALDRCRVDHDWQVRQAVEMLER
jgi:HEAT repeat protein